MVGAPLKLRRAATAKEQLFCIRRQGRRAKPNFILGMADSTFVMDSLGLMLQEFMALLAASSKRVVPSGNGGLNRKTSAWVQSRLLHKSAHPYESNESN